MHWDARETSRKAEGIEDFDVGHHSSSQPGREFTVLQPPSTKFFGTAVLLRFVAAKAMLLSDRGACPGPSARRKPGESAGTGYVYRFNTSS